MLLCYVGYFNTKCAVRCCKILKSMIQKSQGTVLFQHLGLVFAHGVPLFYQAREQDYAQDQNTAKRSFRNDSLHSEHPVALLNCQHDLTKK